MDRQAFGTMQAGVETLRFVTWGAAGAGTLLGRLLEEGGSVAADEGAQAVSDGIAWRAFATARRRFLVADAPAQSARDMVAAGAADLAVLVADASIGIGEQVRRHAAIAVRLGVGHVVLAVDHMDLVGFDAARFEAIAAEFGELARALGIGRHAAIPVSARTGDNVVVPTGRVAWFDGPTLLGHLESVAIASPADGPFRLAVEETVQPGAATPGARGTVTGGRIAVGERVRLARSGREAAVARIIGVDGDATSAVAGEAVTLVLDPPLDVARGDVVGAGEAVPMTARCEADLVWLHETELFPGRSYLLHIGTATMPASVVRIRDRLDPATMTHAPAETLAMGDIARVSLELASQVAMQRCRDNRALGGFSLTDRHDGETVAVGTVAEVQAATNVTQHTTVVDRLARAALMRQQPALVWFTGLSGAGKSTVADLVEQRLHASGRHVFLLDGDALRTGLNRDLGFGEGDRVENIRRAAEVGRLMCEAGLIVLACFISPYRADRATARERFEDGMFLEVFVDTPVDECRRRDPKGLYRRADAGEIRNFTGVDAPYEAPEAPELRLDTLARSPQQCAEDVVAMLRARGIVPG